MPFDLLISRADSFEGIATAPPFPSETIQRIAAGLNAVPEGAHGYRIFRPEDATDPWFWAEWTPEGTILLSASYTHPRFLRNFADMFEEGLAWAGSLSGALFETVEKRRVTAATVDELLAIGGPYVEGQSRVFRETLNGVGREAHGGLEFPLRVDSDGIVLMIDSVSEYLAFHVAPTRPVDVTTMSATLAKQLAGVVVRQFDDHAINFTEAQSGKWLAKAQLRPDGQWQVAPSRQYSTFARMADATIQVAERISEATAGSLLFLGEPYEGEIREEVLRRKSGLGVDFFTWTNSLGLSTRLSDAEGDSKTTLVVWVLDSSDSSKNEECT